MAEMNWAGNYEYRAGRIARPETVEELRELVVGAPAVRALGSRHSFNDLADTPGLLVSTAGLPGTVRIDEASRTVTVGGGVRYGDLARELQEAGWALHNLASLPHISVAGAIATATHGSGDRNGNLATAVAGLRILNGSGELVDLRRGDEGFDGAVVGLGALGVVTEVTLEIRPTFDARQRLFGGVPWDAVLGRLDELTSAAYSVSLFTTWDEPSVSLAWLKELDGAESAIEDDFFGAPALTEARHMIPTMDVRNTTEQLGVAGPWSERLAHFRFEFTPSNGEEIQSEYLVPRSRAVEAIEAVRALAPLVAPLLQITEIRTVAADDLWLSSSYGTDVVGLHFTWVRDQAGVEAVLPQVEAALLPLGARPHWGKLYLDREGVVPSLYPRLADFAALAARFDPDGRFRNPFLARLLP
ncbi:MULTISPECIES: FAD-binding protein [unclassified Leifsonia]|uniref:FAD-binding protein n=1 Tax=unclassified Leifsonia TaxID=2663824 RepID=UPI0008A74502|nr:MULTISPECIES: FAD-binding protein [unclassified Leifsonia]SEI12033.1 xylitol oxidase [Leifsonia sp. CL154]SFL94326.1 xylitol oxidase [Leifsonia sp. CL147]